MLLLLACTSAPSESQRPVHESVRMDDSNSSSTLWSDPSFWTEPGPMAARLLPSGPLTPGSWAVRMATSLDGNTWTADPRILAYGFSSLDLLITEQGILLSGVVTYLENDPVMMEQPAVIALSSQDLEHWGSHRFGIEGASRTWVIDPSLKMRNEQLQLTWYGTDLEGDPAQFPGEHEVFGGTWDGSVFQQESLLFKSEWLADPSRCTLSDQEWLWYTFESHEIRAARSNNGVFTYDTVRNDQLNVPWCQDGTDHLEVWAQGGSGAGSPWKLSVSADGNMEKTQVYEGNLFGQDNCTSPVSGYYQGQYLLFCAVVMVHP